MKQTHIIIITYTQPTHIIDEIRPKHRKFLDRGYEAGLFIASGPNSDKNGGVILASGDLNEIKQLIKQDPFVIENVASYSYHSFDPVKYATAYQVFI